MKFHSKYFDRIRIKPDEDRQERSLPSCEWPGCRASGGYRAPKGRANEGEYHRFCLAHVREYNKQYNYFAGMNEADISSWQAGAPTGHRPTWPLGANSWAAHNGGRWRATGERNGASYSDPFNLFGNRTQEPPRPRRTVRSAELKALNTLGLDETATPEQIKTQYKKLVKRMHPDANGGSRANEDKLREIIAAYDYLRSAGFC
jgi:hypothetical protein